ncbi:calsyntenin-2 [Nematostella vectensis]|uniref:calsyntenin-2 n=1 Tax=Nematostella vectensis TaxID=45351 RepID=UPI0020776201|nr:calsyntenin-2 [Nematostella vectensis]
MLSFKVILTTFCVLAAASAVSEGKKIARESNFQFVEDSYGKALSEYHAVNKKVLHVRATGGKGKIEYSIKEKDTPFSVDAKGHIWLIKALNSDENKFCELTIIAKDAEKRVTTTRVRFDIINMNKHRPQFNKPESEPYICAVTENTRVVRILPKINVTDQDRGEAGKIKRIEVAESGIPFKFNVNDDGSVEVVALKDFDAEKESGYLFDIKAFDGGDPSKTSKPVQVDCRIVDVNEFPPTFESNNVVAVVERGKTYKKILQLTATDKDIGKENGVVCKYVVRTADVPFKITNDGVLYLDKPLGSDAPEYCAFEVAAVDCGGKISVENVNVRVDIKDSCKPGYNMDQLLGKVSIPQCVGKAIITPDLELNECSKEIGVSKFVAKIKLNSNAGKGCDRQRYKASDMYQLCGADKVRDLLPRFGPGKSWTKILQEVESFSNDDATFFFDGEKDHVDIPDDVFPQKLGEEFTISFWMATKDKKKRKSDQVILDSSDANLHNRIHFAVTLKNHNQLSIIHRLESWQGKQNEFFKSTFLYRPDLWKINIADTKWHHFTISVNRSLVSLHIDGQHVGPHRTIPNFRLHASNTKSHAVVGAVWKGKDKKYEKHFRGFLSGMTVRPNKLTSKQTIRCLMGCREHINIGTSLPHGFTATMPRFNTMVIKGTGRPVDFQKILQNLEYQNDLFTPTSGVRNFQIDTTQNGVKLEKISVDIELEKNTKPKIVLIGCGDVQADEERIAGVGVPVCRTLTLRFEGCKAKRESPVNNVMFLDEAVIKVEPALSQHESLNFPVGVRGSTILDDLELEASKTDDGVVIRGVADYKAYERVLREMTYVNKKPKEHPRHTFKFHVSDQNGRFKSNEKVLQISTPRVRPIMANKVRPFNLQLGSSATREERAPVKVIDRGSRMPTGLVPAIIVASACVFLVLVVLGIYRLRKGAVKLEVPASQAEKEEMYWDDTGLSGVRITVNPLQKFQELDLNEDNDSDNGHSDDEDSQIAKKSLEWDESDM